MAAGRRNDWNPAIFGANLLFAAAILLLVAAALATGHGWADRHFLPVFARSRAEQLLIVDLVRLCFAGAGLAVLLVARARLVRALSAGLGRQTLVSGLGILIAVVAAFGTAELVLRTQTWRAAQERGGVEVPRRVHDRELGWTFLSNYIGSKLNDSRLVTYAIDRFGYRVRSLRDPFDPARPTIVLAGESILLGYGLEWPETIAAHVQARTGLQVANLSINAYATDQIYLRLRRELPRFRRPVAVVIPFVPMLFDRDLDRDRPHLDENLRWQPAEAPAWRLVELGRRVLRYRGEADIARGERMARRVLIAELALIRSRGARPVVVVPEYMPEEPTERAVRRRVLDGAGIAYVRVPLQPGWRLREDRHPNPRGAQAIAQAIVAALPRAR